MRILHRACLKRGLSGAKVENPNSSLSSLSWNVGSMTRHSKEIFELLIRGSQTMSSSCRRPAPHRMSFCGRWGILCSGMPRCQLACNARHWLNLCQIRGPHCVEGYKLGYFALQLRDTTTRLTVRLKGKPSLSRNWKVLTLPVASLTLVTSTLSPRGALVITSTCQI